MGHHDLLTWSMPLIALITTIMVTVMEIITATLWLMLMRANQRWHGL